VGLVARWPSKNVGISLARRLGLRAVAARVRSHELEVEAQQHADLFAHRAAVLGAGSDEIRLALALDLHTTEFADARRSIAPHPRLDHDGRAGVVVTFVAKAHALEAQLTRIGFALARIGAGGFALLAV